MSELRPQYETWITPLLLHAHNARDKAISLFNVFVSCRELESIEALRHSQPIIESLVYSIYAGMLVDYSRENSLMETLHYCDQLISDVERVQDIGEIVPDAMAKICLEQLRQLRPVLIVFFQSEVKSDEQTQ